MLEGEINEDAVQAEDKQKECVETMTVLKENEFSKKSRLTDLTLVVEDRYLYVNKGVLATASPVFEAMLYGEFRENQSDLIPLPGKKYDDFVKFLRCFYPHISARVTTDDIYEVLPLAHEYQIQHIVNSCEETFIKLLSENPPESSIYKIMEQADKYELSQLRDKCIEIGAEFPMENLENACTKFKITKELENAVKDKFLKNLRTKYKDVFGHVKTSRTLFSCLGLVAKEQHLVQQYMEGKVTGYYKRFEMRFGSDEKHEMCIGEDIIHVSLYSYYSNEIAIRLTPNKAITLSGRCFVKIHNWMAGINDRSHEIFFKNFKFIDNTKTICDISNNKGRLHMEDCTKGFIHDGILSVDVFIFCISST